MTAKKEKTLLPADEQNKAEEAKITEMEKASLIAEEAEETDGPKETGSYVYCGPSVRGVARQYTVFNGGLPEMVKNFAFDHPLAKALIVPVERFADMRRKLETKGTAEALIFTKLKLEL